VTLAFARAGLHWDDAPVVSAHGRHPRRAVNVCRAFPKVAVLTSPNFGPAELARELGGTGRTFFVCERLGEPDERVFRGDAEEVAGAKWIDPNVVLVLDEARMAGERGWVSSGFEGRGPWALPERAFEHRSGMITKKETRALVLARLGPGPGDLVWDVGAGSGSVAVECARLGAAAIAIERDPESCERIERNAARHGVRVRVVEGEAPAALDGLPVPDAVFVGGSGGGFEEIVGLAARPRPARRRPDPRGAGTGRAGGRDTGTGRVRGRDDVVAGLAGERDRIPAPPRPGDARLRRVRGQAVIGLVAATRNGRRHAAHLARAWPDARYYDGGKPREALCRAWAECDRIVIFLATGAAVRIISPLLVDKRHDPGIVSVDDAARFAVALAGGHAGGANELANASQGP
jgi:precorrin-6Y C5,15-methyltransferase (decarboxylating) CbiT subunit